MQELQVLGNMSIINPDGSISVDLRCSGSMSASGSGADKGEIISFSTIPQSVDVIVKGRRQKKGKKGKAS
jgi:hypothetical protein